MISKLIKDKNYILLILLIVLGFFLRIWKIDKVPVSLFSDELDVGYQAYSIIKTGKDYSGNKWPLSFQSYADERTPIYIYSSVPSVAIFGITPLGVRLPAVLFGTLGIWVIYLLSNQLVKKKFGICLPDGKAGNLEFGILPATFMAISPWHLQYSRAAFEVTELLVFLLFGIYFFLKSIRLNGKYLWLAVLFFSLTPWIYSTAKLFTPFLMLFLFIIWFRDIQKFSKKGLVSALTLLFLLWIPLLYVTFFAKGGLRFNYISVFSDPTSGSESSYSRLYDAQFRQKYGGGIVSKLSSRIIHNKYTFWGTKVINNYFQTFSTEFLFVSGDPNLRHSINGMGQFYKIEIFTLILGSVLFFFSGIDRKIKILIAFWILFGVVPSSITRDGGNHATRLIIILPPLIFLISFGIGSISIILERFMRIVFLTSYCLLLIASFYSYQHLYWVHNPWYSERSWHAGYKEVVDAVKEKESKYNKIIISNSNDDPRIFLAAYYPFPPAIWQKGSENEYIPGFGNLPHYGKFYLGQVDGQIGLTGISKYMDMRTLYIASQSEIKGNLTMEPGKVPEGLKLIKAITYPSGEPAFYFFTKGDRS